ncbi:DNA repair protein RecO [Cellvibrio mixtus]|uniref:DNA repair protein RecO n=1 Tax=Cellvibrio mixtus TaxID=39650 RepID=A0A266Q9Y9_9GAMM|nr:DNA repair protein RecO [Cellvibrio mixtus]OZY86159.1 DNA repair protein RecO [Cellvibrio mixtus]
MRVDLQPAYILHTRPYRDTSLLIDFLTPDHGRVTAVARGVRKTKTPKRQLLNPFSRLLVSWQGKTDMKLLTNFESDNHFLSLTANHLYSGFYLNELLVRLLPEMDSHNGIYHAYEQSLNALQAGEDIEPLLRVFEFRLLIELGYGLDFTQDARNHCAIVPDGFYECHIQEGFFSAAPNLPEQFLLKGECLLAIDCGDYSLPATRLAAKQLARRLLKPLLGSRPLNSRELFVSSKPTE